jgi:hypothetical protein
VEATQLLVFPNYLFHDALIIKSKFRDLKGVGVWMCLQYSHTVINISYVVAAAMKRSWLLIETEMHFYSELCWLSAVEAALAELVRRLRRTGCPDRDLLCFSFISEWMLYFNSPRPLHF